MQDEFTQIVKRNLSEGLVIKNYKELCILLNEQPKTSDSKKAQHKEWKRYFDYEKEGQKYIISEIYDEPLSKEDGRSLGNARKKYDQFQIPIEEENKKGVYSIILNNEIYIGSTNNSFRERFIQHINRANNLPTRKMLTTGGEFKALWVAKDTDTETFIRDKENEYINYYTNKTDFNVVNEKPAWSYAKSNKVKLKKVKYSRIKIKKDDYEKVLILLKNNNIDIFTGGRIIEN